MSTLILHLSDIHLVSEQDVIFGRLSQLAAAACSDVAVHVSQCFIVVSGDLAQSGKEIQYRAAMKLLLDIAKEINARTQIEPTFFLLPGNHDCQLPADASARNDIIENIKRKGSTPAREGQLVIAQSEFWALAAKVNPRQKMLSPWESNLPSENESISFIGLNSPLLATGGDDQGKLFIPVDRLTKEHQDGVVVYLLHHPLNWLQADNARDIHEYLRERGDIALFGHEHREDSLHTRDIYGDASLESYYADVLQDRKAFLRSAFRTIVLSDDLKNIRAARYSWVGDKYDRDDRKSDADWRPLSRNTERGKVLSFSKRHLEWLDDLGVALSHRRKDELKLADIFVWPFLRESLSDKAQTLLVDSQKIEGNDLLREMEINSVYFVLGEEQCGKTTLAKQWCHEARKVSLFPLLVSSAKEDSFRGLMNGDLIEKSIQEQYGSYSISDYMQLKPTERLLILDGFEPLKGGGSSKDELLRHLRQHFSQIILLVNSSPGSEIILDTIDIDASTTASKTFELLPFGYRDRSELIDKWLSIGDDQDQSNEEREAICTRFSKIVDDTLGRNLIPSFPLFILIILQQSETERDLEAVIKNGSHGFLYQALISQTLSKRVKIFSVDTATTYLTEFASRLYASEGNALPNLVAEEFHRTHCADFDLEYSFEKVKLRFLSADIWVESDDGIRFRYPYLYYFFVANHLKSSDTQSLLATVDKLLASIHTERSANILLFLAHLTLNKDLVEKLLAHANSFYPDVPEYNVFESKNLLEQLGVNQTRQIYIEYATRKEALRELENVSSDVLRSGSDEINSQLLQDRDALLSVNRAFKTLQVLGQVLRNHSGSIKAPLKKSIMEACVALGLRTLGSFYDIIERNKENLLEHRFNAQTAGVKSHRINVEALRNDGASFLNGHVLDIATGTLIRVANAIGSEELAPTISKVLSTKANDSRNLIDLSVHLENFTKFPTDQVVDFKARKLTADEVMPAAIVRKFLVRRFYLFPDKKELRSRICDLFSIARKPFQLRAATAGRK